MGFYRPVVGKYAVSSLRGKMAQSSTGKIIFMKEQHSKTKTSFYRRLYVAYLIDSGVNTVPAIIEKTGMPRRTAQDTILALKELDIDYEYVGATKDGYYTLNSWGAINPGWVKSHVTHINEVLAYPALG